jgi:hypothetical protein
MLWFILLYFTGGNTIHSDPFRATFQDGSELWSTPWALDLGTAEASWLFPY